MCSLEVVLLGLTTSNHLTSNGDMS